jgi:hypothetical protein
MRPAVLDRWPGFCLVGCSRRQEERLRRTVPSVHGQAAGGRHERLVLLSFGRLTQLELFDVLSKRAPEWAERAQGRAVVPGPVSVRANAGGHGEPMAVVEDGRPLWQALQGGPPMAQARVLPAVAASGDTRTGVLHAAAARNVPQPHAAQAALTAINDPPVRARSTAEATAAAIVADDGNTALGGLYTLNDARDMSSSVGSSIDVPEGDRGRSTPTLQRSRSFPRDTRISLASASSSLASTMHVRARSSTDRADARAGSTPAAESTARRRTVRSDGSSPMPSSRGPGGALAASDPFLDDTWPPGDGPTGLPGSALPATGRASSAGRADARARSTPAAESTARRSLMSAHHASALAATVPVSGSGNVAAAVRPQFSMTLPATVRVSSAGRDVARAAESMALSRDLEARALAGRAHFLSAGLSLAATMPVRGSGDARAQFSMSLPAAGRASSAGRDGASHAERASPTDREGARAPTAPAAGAQSGHRHGVSGEGIPNGRASFDTNGLYTEASAGRAATRRSVAVEGGGAMDVPSPKSGAEASMAALQRSNGKAALVSSGSPLAARTTDRASPTRAPTSPAAGGQSGHRHGVSGVRGPRLAAAGAPRLDRRGVPIEARDGLELRPPKRRNDALELPPPKRRNESAGSTVTNSRALARARDEAPARPRSADKRANVAPRPAGPLATRLSNPRAAAPSQAGAVAARMVQTTSVNSPAQRRSPRARSRSPVNEWDDATPPRGSTAWQQTAHETRPRADTTTAKEGPIGTPRAGPTGAPGGSAEWPRYTDGGVVPRAHAPAISADVAATSTVSEQKARAAPAHVWAPSPMKQREQTPGDFEASAPRPHSPPDGRWFGLSERREDDGPRPRRPRSAEHRAGGTSRPEAPFMTRLLAAAPAAPIEPIALAAPRERGTANVARPQKGWKDADGPIGTPVRTDDAAPRAGPTGAPGGSAEWPRFTDGGVVPRAHAPAISADVAATSTVSEQKARAAPAHVWAPSPMKQREQTPGVFEVSATRPHSPPNGRWVGLSERREDDGPRPRRPRSAEQRAGGTSRPEAPFMTRLLAAAPAAPIEPIALAAPRERGTASVARPQKGWKDADEAPRLPPQPYVSALDPFRAAGTIPDNSGAATAAPSSQARAIEPQVATRKATQAKFRPGDDAAIENMVRKGRKGNASQGSDAARPPVAVPSRAPAEVTPLDFSTSTTEHGRKFELNVNSILAPLWQDGQLSASQRQETDAILDKENAARGAMLKADSAARSKARQSRK